jgi:hypothetical protein
MRAATKANLPDESEAPTPPPGGSASFINLGGIAIAVRGPVSGRERRFDAPGAVVGVDACDRVLLAPLRQLREA